MSELKRHMSLTKKRMSAMALVSAASTAEQAAVSNELHAEIKLLNCDVVRASARLHRVSDKSVPRRIPISFGERKGLRILVVLIWHRRTALVVNLLHLDALSTVPPSFHAVIMDRWL
eukprot:3297493-Rhodomonas_salina.2